MRTAPTSDLPPALVDAVQIHSGDVAFVSSHPVHEYIELRRFRREIRKRAHFHAMLRLFSACLIASVFVFTFLQDASDNGATQGFAPRGIAAR